MVSKSKRKISTKRKTGCLTKTRTETVVMGGHSEL